MNFGLATTPCHFDLVMPLVISNELCPLSFRPSEASGEIYRALRQPKLPGGASRCATGKLRMPVVMLREFRVSDHPLSFRRNGASCHFAGTVPLVISTERKPLSFRPSGAPCHFDVTVPLVISTERRPLSFRPSGSEWRNLLGAPPISRALRQRGAREGPFFALWRGARCGRGRFRPVAHHGRPCRAIRRVSMCGSLAKWGNRGRDSRSGRE